MKKPVLGLVVGGVLGIFDGLSALVSAPETAPQIMGIVFGSTIKGVLAGVLIGWFAKKVDSLAATLVFGTIVGAALAYVIVALGGGLYFWEIVLPGSIVGLIVGFAAQRYGTSGAAAVRSSVRA